MPAVLSPVEQAAPDVLDTRQLLHVLTAVKRGDFSSRMPLDKTGVAGKIADALNEIIDVNERILKEYERISVTVGKEGKLTFWGQSFVADPFGRIIAKAAAESEEVLVVECDLSKIEETRQNWPFLRDRRIDAYEGLRFRFGK